MQAFKPGLKGLFRFAFHLLPLPAVPILVPESKLFWTLCAFTASTELLLLVICLVTRGNWFGVAGSAITPNDYVKYLQTYGLWLLGGIVFSTPGPRMLYDFLRKKVPIAVVPILLTIFWVSVYWMVKGQSDPFMYFHF